MSSYFRSGYCDLMVAPIPLSKKGWHEVTAYVYGLTSRGLFFIKLVQ